MPKYRFVIMCRDVACCISIVGGNIFLGMCWKLIQH